MLLVVLDGTVGSMMVVLFSCGFRQFSDGILHSLMVEEIPVNRTVWSTGCFAQNF